MQREVWLDRNKKPLVENSNVEQSLQEKQGIVKPGEKSGPGGAAGKSIPHNEGLGVDQYLEEKERRRGDDNGKSDRVRFEKAGNLVHCLENSSTNQEQGTGFNQRGYAEDIRATEGTNMEGLEVNEGGLDVGPGSDKKEGEVGDTGENMVLSPGRVTVRKWRRAARKDKMPITMTGTTSPMKRILEACLLARKKNREGSLSPKGKGNQTKGARKKSPTKQVGGGAKRKLTMVIKDDGITGKKHKSGLGVTSLEASKLGESFPEETAEPGVQARRAL